MTRSRAAWLIAIAYAGAIIALSSIPGRALPEPPAVNFDKVVHAAIYAVLGALVCRAWWTGGRRSIAAAILGAACATGFGCLDELYQTLTPGRFPSVFDAVADGVGASLGAAAAWGILRRHADSKLRR